MMSSEMANFTVASENQKNKKFKSFQAMLSSLEILP